MDLRIMMTFVVVMKEAIAINAIEMMTRLPTMVPVLMRSMVLSMDKTIIF